MRIYYPTDGIGCRVLVSEGFIEAFNDETPGGDLLGLVGATVSFDDQFRLTGVHTKNGDLKKWEGSYLGLFLDRVRDWAEEQGPKKVSGVFQAVTPPPTPALPPPLPEPPIFRLVHPVSASPAPRISPYQYKQVAPTVVARRRVG